MLFPLTTILSLQACNQVFSFCYFELTRILLIKAGMNKWMKDWDHNGYIKYWSIKSEYYHSYILCFNDSETRLFKTIRLRNGSFYLSDLTVEHTLGSYSSCKFQHLIGSVPLNCVLAPIIFLHFAIRYGNCLESVPSLYLVCTKL